MQQRKIIPVVAIQKKQEASVGWRRLPGVGGAQTMVGSCGMDAWMKMCSWSSWPWDADAARGWCCVVSPTDCVSRADAKAVVGRRCALCARCCWETTPPIDSHTQQELSRLNPVNPQDVFLHNVNTSLTQSTPFTLCMRWVRQDLCSLYWIYDLCVTLTYFHLRVGFYNNLSSSICSYTVL